MNIYDDFFERKKTLMVAELSANHNGDFEIARRTIEAAKESGADAIKLQTYTADTMTIDCDNEYFQIRQGTIWDGETFYSLYRRASMPWEWQPKLKKIAEDLGLLFFSTPFDATSVDFLEAMKVPFYKIASFEITDIPLIEYAASKGKPLVISTGIATLADIEDAVNASTRQGNSNIILLKCTSAYPAPVEEANLLTIPNMNATFHLPVGLSDHSQGWSVPVAAVALGAVLIEKHFILDRNMGGPDAAFSMEPREFAAMAGAIRVAERALGHVSYQLSAETARSRQISRSIFIVSPVSAGETFTEKNLKIIRPGFGLPPKNMPRVMGKRARRDLVAGTPLAWEDLE